MVLGILVIIGPSTCGEDTLAASARSQLYECAAIHYLIHVLQDSLQTT